MNTVNSFFCGAGGFDIGFINAGFEITAAYDFDKFAVKSYQHNIGNHVHLADISKMAGKDIPFATGWLFGFPCQDISISGKRKGMVAGKTRSGLFYEIMRLLGEVEEKPLWILAENVKMVKEYIPVIEEEYKKAGYRLVTPQLYDSKYWGLAQTRERYFLLGIREDVQLDFSFPKESHDNVPKLVSVLESEVDEKYYVSNEKAETVIKQAVERLNLSGSHKENVPDLPDNVIEPPCETIDKLGGMFGRSKAGRCWNKNGVSPTLTTPSGGYSQPLVLIPISVKNQCTKFISESEVANTLLARDYKGFGNQTMNAVIEGYRVRRLIPREYARLQGFPESYQQVVSDTQFYKQMGNAVSVNVAEAIAKELYKVIKNQP